MADLVSLTEAIMILWADAKASRRGLTANVPKILPRRQFIMLYSVTFSAAAALQSLLCLAEVGPMPKWVVSCPCGVIIYLLGLAGVAPVLSMLIRVLGCVRWGWKWLRSCVYGRRPWGNLRNGAGERLATEIELQEAAV
jgi:hypothetical protein